jgi:hypothetical protein
MVIERGVVCERRNSFLLICKVHKLLSMNKVSDAFYILTCEEGGGPVARVT